MERYYEHNAKILERRWTPSEAAGQPRGRNGSYAEFLEACGRRVHELLGWMEERVNFMNVSINTGSYTKINLISSKAKAGAAASAPNTAAVRTSVIPTDTLVLSKEAVKWQRRSRKDEESEELTYDRCF